MSVVIIGVGALGSHVALFGRNWKEGLTVVDFDSIESKNVQSQFHTKMALRRNKAEAVKQAFQGMFGTQVKAVPHKLTKDNVETLLGGATLVLDCTDNAEARRLIQGYVKKHGTPCLHGALSADGSFGRVVWTEMFALDEEGAEGQATCEDGVNLPFHGVVASQIALVAQRFLTLGEKRSYQITPTGIIRLS